MCHSYGSNTYCRNHKSVIRTDYIHNTHCEKYLSLTQHNILPTFHLDIYIILWYTRIVIEFCTISSSEAWAAWPMCGEIRLCTFVRFVRCVTLIGDYYALLRSRSALCLYGFCRVGLQLLGILERDEWAFYASSSLYCICRLWKNSNYTTLRKSDTLISYFRAK